MNRKVGSEQIVRGTEPEATVEMTEMALACPQCEGVVETVRHEDIFRYGDGESAVNLPVILPVRICRACGIEFLDHEAERVKHEALCRHFGVLTPWEIREIRKRHDLSRAAFAEVTGLGAASLGRWETGALIQSLANDRYLRLLASPGGLDVLKAVIQWVDAGKKVASGPSGSGGSRFRCLELDEQIKQEARQFNLFKDAG